MTSENTFGTGEFETTLLSRYEFAEKHNKSLGCDVDTTIAAVNSDKIDPTTGDYTPDFSAVRLVCFTHKVYSAPFVPAR